MAKTSEPTPEPPTPTASTPAFRAAQYVRMSTEHQQYSTLNQADKIREYADKRGIEIVRTYADDGKSGLSIGGRAALHDGVQQVSRGRRRLVRLEQDEPDAAFFHYTDLPMLPPEGSIARAMIDHFIAERGAHHA